MFGNCHKKYKNSKQKKKHVSCTKKVNGADVYQKRDVIFILTDFFLTQRCVFVARVKDFFLSFDTFLLSIHKTL